MRPSGDGSIPPEASGLPSEAPGGDATSQNGEEHAKDDDILWTGSAAQPHGTRTGSGTVDAYTDQAVPEGSHAPESNSLAPEEAGLDSPDSVPGTARPSGKSGGSPPLGHRARHSVLAELEGVLTMRIEPGEHVDLFEDAPAADAFDRARAMAAASDQHRDTTARAGAVSRTARAASAAAPGQGPGQRPGQGPGRRRLSAGEDAHAMKYDNQANLALPGSATASASMPAVGDPSSKKLSRAELADAAAAEVERRHREAREAKFLNGKKAPTGPAIGESIGALKARARAMDEQRNTQQQQQQQQQTQSNPGQAKEGVDQDQGRGKGEDRQEEQDDDDAGADGTETPELWALLGFRVDWDDEELQAAGSREWLARARRSGGKGRGKDEGREQRGTGGDGGEGGLGAGGRAGAGAADPMLGPGAPGYVDPSSAAAAPPPPLPPPSDLAEGNLRLELTSKIIGDVTSGRGGGGSGIDRVYHVSTLAGDDVAFELFPGGRYRMRFTNGAAHQAVLTVGLRVVRQRDPMAGRHRLLGRGEVLSPDGSEGEGGGEGEGASGQPTHDDLTWSGNSRVGGGMGMGSAQGALPSSELDLDTNPGQDLAALMEQMEGTARAAGKVLQGVRNEALRMTTRQATHTKVVKDHLWSLDTSMACYVAVAVVLAGLQVLLVRALAEEVRGDGALIPFHRYGKGRGGAAGGTSVGRGVGVWRALCGSVVGGAVGWMLQALQWLVRHAAGLLDLMTSCVGVCLGYCSRSGRGAQGSVRGAKGHARGGRRAPVPSRGVALPRAGGTPRHGSGADGRSQYAAMMNARMAHRTAASGRTPPP